MTNTSALVDIVKELVTTERNYVKKLRILKTEYADPLRNFSRNKNTAIIGSYEAKTLFGNVDQLLPVNEAFLADLEKMDSERGPGVGEVALKHFKMLKGFEHYRQYFAKHEEVQKMFEQEFKKNSRFAEYIEVCLLLSVAPLPSSTVHSASSTLPRQIRETSSVCENSSLNHGSAFRDIP